MSKPNNSDKQTSFLDKWLSNPDWLSNQNGYQSHHKDCLTYSGGTDRSGELCYKTTLLR